MAKKFPPIKSSKKVKALAEKKTREYLFDLILCYQKDIGDLILSTKASKLSTNDLRKIAEPLADVTSFIAVKLGRQGAGRVNDAVARYAKSIGAQFHVLRPAKKKAAARNKKNR